MHKKYLKFGKVWLIFEKQIKRIFGANIKIFLFDVIIVFVKKK